MNQTLTAALFPDVDVYLSLAYHKHNPCLRTVNGFTVDFCLRLSI